MHGPMNVKIHIFVFVSAHWLPELIQISNASCFYQVSLELSENPVKSHVTYLTTAHFFLLSLNLFDDYDVFIL